MIRFLRINFWGSCEVRENRNLFTLKNSHYMVVLYKNVLYVQVMYYFTEQFDFKISSKLI